MSSSFSNMSLKDLHEAVLGRNLLMPDFQRRYEWDAKKILHLVDSIAKGISIGSIRIWDAGDYEVNTKEFGDISGTSSLSNKYVLDGQQRLTTLHYLIKNEGRCKGIYINTDSLAVFYGDSEANFGIQLFAKFSPKAAIPTQFVSLAEVLTEKLDMDHLSHKVVRNLSKFYSDFMNYQVQLDTMKITPAQASIIFERINTSSKPLSMLQIMVARCNSHIALSDKFSELRDSLSSGLKDNININQCDPLKLLVQDVRAKGLRRQSILELDPKYIAMQWPLIHESFIQGIDYLEGIGINKKSIVNNIIVMVIAKYFFIAELDKISDIPASHSDNLTLLVRESEMDKIQMSSTNYTQNLMVAVQDIYDSKFTKTSDYMKSTKL